MFEYWGNYMINPCSLCLANCCKTYMITVTSFDVLRICTATSKHYSDFTVLHKPGLIYDPDMVLDTTDGCGSYILGLKSHPCIFLGDYNRCNIHDFSPLSCRRFPHTLDSKINARFCPPFAKLFFSLKKPGVTTSIYKKELDQYKQIVKQWNRSPGKQADCIRFLLERTDFLADFAYIKKKTDQEDASASKDS